MLHNANATTDSGADDLNASVYDAADEAMNIDPVTRDHSYSKNPNLEKDVRKSGRLRKSVDRLKYEAKSYCIVCGRLLKDIGIKVDAAVCSTECWNKQ